MDAVDSARALAFKSLLRASGFGIGVAGHLDQGRFSVAWDFGFSCSRLQRLKFGLSGFRGWWFGIYG